MVQGDEPLLDPSLLDQLVDTLRDPLVQIANIMSPISSDADFKNTNTVKVVTDNQFNAVYYSCSPIPCSANPSKQTLYQQTGLIGFKSQVLELFAQSEPSFLEIAESIDLNRMISAGVNIKMIPTSINTIGVDTAADLEYAEQP